MTKFLRPSHWRRMLGGNVESMEPSTPAAAAPSAQTGVRKAAAAPRGEDEQVERDVDLNPIIERRAYFLWRNDGCPGGRDIYYWHRAEEEVRLAAAEGTLADL